MFSIFHIDKINNNNAAQISQAQLACYDLRRFQIGLENRVIEAAYTNIPAGIDIYGGERLGLIEKQIST